MILCLDYTFTFRWLVETFLELWELFVLFLCEQTLLAGWVVDVSATF